MKLYLKIDLPQGKRIRLVDPRTKQVDYNQQYKLYPDEPVEIADDIAERLLQQEPHLIGKTPLHATTSDDGEDKINIPAVLQQLADKDFNELTSDELSHYGELLGANIPSKAKKELKIKLLEQRCEELAAP